MGDGLAFPYVLMFPPLNCHYGGRTWLYAGIFFTVGILSNLDLWPECADVSFTRNGQFWPLDPLFFPSYRTSRRIKGDPTLRLPFSVPPVTILCLSRPPSPVEFFSPVRHYSLLRFVHSPFKILRAIFLKPVTFPGPPLPL